MKKLLSLVAALALVGCANQTPPTASRAAFTTLSSIADTGNTALDGWAIYVKTQRAANAAIVDPVAHANAALALQALEDKVSAGYNAYLKAYQTAAQLAADMTSGDYQAALTNATQAAADFTNLVNQLKK